MERNFDISKLNFDNKWYRNSEDFYEYLVDNLMNVLIAYQAIEEDGLKVNDIQSSVVVSLYGDYYRLFNTYINGYDGYDENLDMRVVCSDKKAYLIDNYNNAYYDMNNWGDEAIRSSLNWYYHGASDNYSYQK